MKQTRHFWKLHGCGNDAVVIADFEDGGTNWQELSPQILHRHYGVGADALMVVKPSKKADFSLETYNPDGTDGVLCGNGTRCTVRFLCLEDILSAPQGQVSFETSAGLTVPCQYEDAGKTVNVMLGAPVFEAEKIPFIGDDPELGIEIKIESDAFDAYPLNFGTPRAVIFVSDVDALDLEKIGPAIEHHEAFPARTNADFVQVISNDEIRLRTWERGAGATLACATGSCGAAVISHLKRSLSSSLKVHQQSGDILLVNWDRKRDEVWLCGPAEEVYRGEFKGSSVTTALLPPEQAD